MVKPVDRIVPDFAKAGADLISFHPEASEHVDRTIGLIKESGCKAGLVFNPATPLAYLDHVLPKLDLVLIMSVNPGFGGQKFIPYALDKLRAVRERIDQTGRDIWLEVDGGVKVDNIAADRAGRRRHLRVRLGHLRHARLRARPSPRCVPNWRRRSSHERRVAIDRVRTHGDSAGCRARRRVRPRRHAARHAARHRGGGEAHAEQIWVARALDEQTVRSYIGDGIPRLAKRAADRARWMASRAPTLFERALGLFERHYRDTLSAAHPAVSRGRGRACASSRATGFRSPASPTRRRRFTLPLLEATGLRGLLRRWW